MLPADDKSGELSQTSSFARTKANFMDTCPPSCFAFWRPFQFPFLTSSTTIMISWQQCYKRTSVYNDKNTRRNYFATIGSATWRMDNYDVAN